MVYIPRNPNGQAAMAASAPIVMASDQSPIPTKTGTLELAGLSAGSLNADLLVSTDVSLYQWVSVQLLGAWSGTITFQASNDNSTWVSVVLYTESTTSGGSTATAASNNLFAGPLSYRYLRVRMTSWTSGTATGVIELYTTPPGKLGGTMSAVQSGTWSTNTVFTASATSSSPLNFYFNAALLATPVQVVSGVRRLHTFHIYNPNASVAFVQFFNTLAAGVTIGTTTPVQSYAIPAGGVLEDQFVVPHNWSTAITVAATTTATGSTAPGTGLVVNLGHI